jgi:hypothetical protein
MIDTLMCESELRRIRHAPGAAENIPGMGTVRFIVTCDRDAMDVLKTAKSVMDTISCQCASGWNEDTKWEDLLPKCFVKSCAGEMDTAEAEVWFRHWQALSEVEREAEEQTRKWSLSNWLYWFTPSERSWQWWDAQIIDENIIAFAVAVESWPFPWGAISWLFRGSGAISVEAES